ncbi:golvesin C-terminal-like domain-containing protein [Streptomyces blattellae]|uniref:golvesin C-terminal-like domain-containing protein n=1 Tax=Streptomyces blattellae TaxID=2569855 RepID=UPI001E2C38D4|nr:hypothetical protein [Streptomyces blattellae]
MPAQASEPTPPKNATQWRAPDTQDVDKPGAVPSRERTELLGEDYEKSTDTAFTTSGDGTGFHLLVADQENGYAWKTAATLSEPGFDADTWIGNACLTASGKRAAVAYAPRTFTNDPELMARGAFAAVVDLTTGEVTKLPFQASLAYFSPGCGDGEQAVFTQLSYEGDAKQQTRLVTVDTATGRAGTPVTYPGQITSAVPTKDGIVAAYGNRLVAAGAKGELREITRTESVPFQLTVDAAGGLTYIDRTKSRSTQKASTGYARYLDSGKLGRANSRPSTLASGVLTDWDLTSSADGTVYITGKATTKGPLPKAVKNPGGITKGALVSSHGEAALTTSWADGKDTRIRPEEALAERTARISLRLLDTKKTVTLDAQPGQDRIGGKEAELQGAATSPALPQPEKTPAAKDGSSDSGGLSTQTVRTQLAAASPSDPGEDAAERTCAVARNDVKKQAFQPTPRQVEWAVDQAVVGKLDFYRSPDWKNTGMAGYQPQGLFPPILLEGDPNGTLDTEDGDNDRWHIPSQILLGVTAQESNMWQATRFAVPGVTSNSLIGNYYGVDYSASGEQQDPWAIDWSEADCGYGITQATDGMRLAGKEKPGETAMSTLKQEAVALDYTANIAYGAQILSDKWNQTRKAGMKVNDGHPKWIENWFFALWAYNSGFYETADSDGHWGVGWTNNPANPLWKANRLPFLENASGGDSYGDAAHPQDWPYEEKVIGWAARPIAALFGPGDVQAGYRASWWNTGTDRTAAKPPVDLFCDASNSCDESKIGDNDSNDPGQGACTLDSGNDETNPHWLHCWWNKSVEWKNCTTGAQCGNQVHRFNTTYPEQADANSYPPRCSSGLPSNALIVDDVDKGVIPTGSASRSCGASTSDGTFTLNYSMWNGTYPGKMDTHQIGAGYGNHFYFAHTRQPESTAGTANRMRAIGVWKLGRQITEANGQAKVYVHIPDHGAQTAEATYKITTANGVESKTISQTANASNKWVDLGAYFFTGMTPEVSLSNFTSDGTGDKDIAWDAIAFVPGDYSGIPSDLTFGDADPNAPEPAPIEPPNTISGSFFPSVTSALKSSMPTIASATRPGTVSSTQLTAEATASCSVTTGTMTYTRTQACIRDEAVITYLENGTPRGDATFDYQHEINLDVKSDTFTQTVTIDLKSMDAAINSVQFEVDFDCRGYCQVETPVWTGSKTWTKGDNHTAVATSRIKWNKGTDHSVINPLWTIKGAANGVPTNTNDIEKEELDVRCDVEVGTTPGCVFSHYTPTYVMNSKKFPAAAAHAWLIQNKLPGHYGLRGYNPLTFLADDVLVPDPPTSNKSLVDHNRDTICPDAWQRSPLATMSDNLGAGDVSSCDEFPFAASWQSAAIPKTWGGKNLKQVSDGKECLNTIAVKGSDGLWRLIPDSRAHVPTWTEPCGRSSMSNNQNTQSMSLFPKFRRDNRVMEGDDYWLDAQKP